ncbi:MAG: DNA topoisomerase I, partial [Thermoplasmata archaeon]|nr:DNA topoisomerase I [Thermoplasmata archaeon]
IDAREVNSIPIGTDGDGNEILVRVGRYGPYLQRGEDRVSVPEDVAPDELTIERSTELLDAPSGDRELGVDPETQLPVYVRAGRFGPYVQLGEAGEESGKPKTASVFSSMTPETLTLDQALDLLRIPRVVGTDPETGEEVVAHNGRYGPYLKRGKDTRSLVTEDQLLSIDLDGATAIFAQPKARRGRTSAGPLRELGADPATGEPVVVRDGRFGPYVTDGSTNASLRRGDSVEAIDIERAAELLAERRAAGPSRRKASGSKKAAKKAAKKSTKKSTKKATKKAAKKATATGSKISPDAPPRMAAAVSDVPTPGDAAGD